MSVLSQIAEREKHRLQQATAGRPFDPDEVENQLGSGSLQTPASTGHRRPPLGPSNGRTPGNSGQFVFPSAGFMTPPSSQQESVLGCRGRSPDIDVGLGEWSRPNKVLLTEFATNAAAEYGVAEDKLPDFIDASTLPTHQLLIVTLAAVLGGREESTDNVMQAYLASSTFKASRSPTLSLGLWTYWAQEHVVGQVRAVLLDPKLSSYKNGFMHRLLADQLRIHQRHIRLNPGIYHIPQQLRSAITNRVFGSAVSSELSDGWNKKLDIATLGKSLAWNNTQEMTDKFWGRFAWLQFFLVDYRKEGKHECLFWDAADTFLADIFEESLREHVKMMPLKKGKLRSGKQMPAWQKAISRAVKEMEGYSLEELAGEDGHDGDDGDDQEIDPNMDTSFE
ncbi:hypothetical protein B0H10DRAFT_1938047 [Mycena sp. CBHHK59/15]|nr:hypothetical protein B0H10DRAFT_1938047 [Mycena sp. CBHHK59/15]